MDNRNIAKGKKKSLLKRVNSWLHLWLGLASGLVVFVVCLTGTIFVFHEEINDFNNAEVLSVQVPKGAHKLPADRILANLKKEYPKIMPSQYTEFSDQNRSVLIKSMDRSEGASLMSLCSVYADPYTGKILKVDHTYGFFRLMVRIHINLMLGKTGSYIVQISTVIFLLELISGLIWWWPKRWSNSTVNKSFKIKWNANWKRINLDLHNVLGFYILPLALLLTVTALMISYAPVKTTVFKMFGGTGKETPVYRIKHPADSTKNSLALEQIIDPFRKELPGLRQLTATIPSPRSGAVLMRLEQSATLLTFEGSQQFVDQYSGLEIPISKEIHKGDRLLNTTIALHIGAWYGLVGKILTFIVCLICTSLPITGFIIWYNRKFKKKKVIKSIQ